MNFLDALKSGKWIRRRTWALNEFGEIDEWGDLEWINPKKESMDFVISEFLAEDWEVDIKNAE